jgi:hypothetical protein
MISWRNATILLALVCCWQSWQSCTASPPIVEHVAPAPVPERPGLVQAFTTATSTPPDRPVKKHTFFGMTPPAWAQHLLPQPGEKLSAYRDRILPLAEVALAPQRARVARLRDQFDDHQRAELDAAVTETAEAIEARVMTAVMNNEFQAFKPMTGVAMAREVLDLVDRGNSRFVTSMNADQRAALAASHFDFADYLLFATRWEDALR